MDNEVVASLSSQKWAGHLLTPDSVPYYMARYVIDDTGKKQYGSFRTYLDGAVFNITGIPSAESIIQYTKAEKVTVVGTAEEIKTLFQIPRQRG